MNNIKLIRWKGLDHAASLCFSINFLKQKNAVHESSQVSHHCTKKSGTNNSVTFPLPPWARRATLKVISVLVHAFM